MFLYLIYIKMKYLKSYKFFESSYSFEEYIGLLSDELGNFNLSPVQIRELINRLDIEGYIKDGISPKNVVDELDKDMELGKSGYPDHWVNQTHQSQIKYL